MIEKRIITGTSLRAMGQGDEMQLVGYAARFGVASHDLGGYREFIAPGAFKRAIAEKQDVIATYNHDASAIPLGRTKSGTLRLSEDIHGLSFRCQLDPAQQAHRDLHAAVARQDVDSCSFAFTVPENGDEWDHDYFDETGQRCSRRTLKDVNLHDISIVNSPAYPQTEVVARAKPTTAPGRVKDPFLQQNARLLLKRYRPMALEDIIRCQKLGYSEDTMQEMRGAAYADQIRRDFKRDGGQAADPEVKLRKTDDDDSFDYDDDDSWDEKEHQRAVQFHRNCAHQAKSMADCSNHHRCADLHDTAARLYPDLPSSKAARMASRAITLGEIF